MVPELRLTLLGGFTATRDNQPISGLTSHKAQALLCYLAVSGRAFSRPFLAGLLWPDIPEANARMNLRKELARLNEVLRPYLRIDRDSVALDPTANWRLDVQEFETLLDTPPQHQTPSIAQLTAAVALYQGDFLEGFYVLNSPTLEEWLLRQRGRFRERVLYALQTLAAAYTHQADHNQAITTLHQLLALEPWREEAHCQLMRLYAQNGQRAAALAQYEICRQVLADELAVEPDTATLALVAVIRAGDIELDHKEVKPFPLTTAIEHFVPQRNLPLPSTPLVGRESEQAQLAALLANPQCRLVTLVGPGGIGKTHLALATAATLLDRYPHGVYFVALAPLSEPDTMASAIVASMGYPLQNDGRSPKQQLLDHMRAKELLLVLDNVEHLLAGVMLFTEILQAAPNVRLLVTSREQLRLSSETSFVLGGLAVADAVHSQGSAAVQLFVQTAQRVRPSFAPSAADWPAVVQVCRLVAGMPLGLILAASWIDMLTPADLAAEIHHSFDFLAADLHDLPERHRSLRAIFTTTWQRLSAAEQDVTRRLAVFRGSFTRSAAATVAGASLAILTTLSHKSLIQVRPDRRYEIHELLRQFALETVAEQMTELRDAHSAYYCAFLAQRETDLKGARQPVAMTEIEADSENVRTAWRWAVQREQLDQLAQALDSLGLFYLRRSRLHEGAAFCRLAVEQLAMISLGEKSDSQTEGRQPCAARCQVRLLVWQSIFQRNLREPEAAQLALRQAQEILTGPLLVGVDTRSEQAHLLLEQAEVIAKVHFLAASTLVEQSLAVYRTLQEPWRMAQGLALLGEAVRYLGDLDRARELQEAGLALRQDLGDTIGIAHSLKNLGGIARHAGNFEKAEEFLRKCISLFEEVDDQGQMARGVNDLAVTLVHAGKFADGLPLLEKGLTIHYELNLPGEPGVPTTVKGFALMHLGHYDAALPHLQWSLSFYAKPETGYSLKNLGRIALAQKRYEQARQHLDEALKLFRDNRDMNGLGQTLGCLGYVALRQHNRQQAQAYICENLQLAAETCLFLPSMTALAGIALLSAEQGDYATAIELYTVALQNGHVAHSRWYQDVVGQYIDAGAQTLPAEIVAAAQVRGRTRTWRSTVPELLTAWQGTMPRTNV